jgi:cysteine-rich repeat protein
MMRAIRLAWRSRFGVSLMLLSVGVFLAACGSDDEDSGTASGGTGGGTAAAGGSGAVVSTGGGPSSGGTGASGGSAGWTGGTSGGGGVVGDSCPPAPLDPLVEPHIEGTTLGRTDDFNAYCGGSGPDIVYQVDGGGDGTLLISLTSMSAGYSPVLHVRDICDQAASAIACLDVAANPGSLALPANGKYAVIVDGRDGTAGDFLLDFFREAPTCGDGIRNATEACDRGPDIAGDGCDANCMFEGIDATADVCPGPAATVTTRSPLVLNGYTLGYTDDYAAACGAVEGGPDRVYAFTPQVDGTLDVTLTPANGSFDAVLSVYATCAADMALDGLLACSDVESPGAAEHVSLPVVMNSLYYVVVDGYGDAQRIDELPNSGAFELVVGLQR